MTAKQQHLYLYPVFQSESRTADKLCQKHMVVFGCFPHKGGENKNALIRVKSGDLPAVVLSPGWSN